MGKPIIACTTLTFQSASTLLRLESSTGVLYWTAAADLGRKEGCAAGSALASGYWQIKTMGRSYLAHRVVWLLAHGEWPMLAVDHINGNKLDNRPANLRLVTASENAQNQRAAQSSNLSSGMLGVAYSNADPVRRRGAYEARIKINGKSTYLGRFKTAQAAHDAYLEAKRKVHPAGML